MGGRFWIVPGPNFNASAEHSLLTCPSPPHTASKTTAFSLTFDYDGDILQRTVWIKQLHIAWAHRLHQNLHQDCTFGADLVIGRFSARFISLLLTVINRLAAVALPSELHSQRVLNCRNIIVSQTRCQSFLPINSRWPIFEGAPAKSCKFGTGYGISAYTIDGANWMPRPLVGDENRINIFPSMGNKLL